MLKGYAFSVYSSMQFVFCFLLMVILFKKKCITKLVVSTSCYLLINAYNFIIYHWCNHYFDVVRLESCITVIKFIRFIVSIKSLNINSINRLSVICIAFLQFILFIGSVSVWLYSSRVLFLLTQRLYV